MVLIVRCNQIAPKMGSNMLVHLPCVYLDDFTPDVLTSALGFCGVSPYSFFSPHTTGTSGCGVILTPGLQWAVL